MLDVARTMCNQPYAETYKSLDWPLKPIRIGRDNLADFGPTLNFQVFYFSQFEQEAINFTELINGRNGLFQRDLQFLMKINILLNSVQIMENGLF